MNGYQSKGKLLVIGSEAGSGSTLAPVIRRMKWDVRTYCTTRAASAFSELGIRPQIISDPKDREAASLIAEYIIDTTRPDAVLTTLLGPEETSLDRAATRVCSRRHLKHIAVLDSWMNLDSRFDKDGDGFIHIPSYVCVPDNLTQRELIRLGLPETNIVVTGHPFFDEISRIQIRRGNRPRIGFVLQPLSSLIDEGLTPHPGYTEASVVGMFFKAIETLDFGSASPEIIFKEHPRVKSRYEIPSSCHFAIGVASEGSGWEFIKGCTVVVGMSSNLLIYSFLAAIPTIITQPGLSLPEDPNILTRYGILENIDSPAGLYREISHALRDPLYQLDETLELRRSSFPTGGRNSDNIIAIITKR